MESAIVVQAEWNVQQKPHQAMKVAGEATYVYAEVAGGWHL